MPLDAPVTSATWPATEKEGSSVMPAAPHPHPGPPPPAEEGARHGIGEDRPPPLTGEGWESEPSRRDLLCLLAQRVFLDLAGRGLWQRAEDDRLWRLVVRHVRAAE